MLYLFGCCYRHTNDWNETDEHDRCIAGKQSADDHAELVKMDITYHHPSSTRLPSNKAIAKETEPAKRK